MKKNKARNTEFSILYNGPTAEKIKKHNQGQPTRIYIGSGLLKPSSEYCLTKDVDTFVKTYTVT